MESSGASFRINQLDIWTITNINISEACKFISLFPCPSTWHQSMERVAGPHSSTYKKPACTHVKATRLSQKSQLLLLAFLTFTGLSFTEMHIEIVIIWSQAFLQRERLAAPPCLELTWATSRNQIIILNQTKRNSQGVLTSFPPVPVLPTKPHECKPTETN